MSTDLTTQDAAPLVDYTAGKLPELTPMERRVNEVATALDIAYPLASKLVLTEQESKALGETFSDDAVEILSSGEIYIPHIHISRRLSDVLGRGQWALVRRRDWIEPAKEAHTIYAECVLLVRGHYVGESIGGQDYWPGNDRMDFGDALEGAQSEALRRIAAKRLSVGDQAWDPSYARKWTAANAVQVWCVKKGRGSGPDKKPLWRRKDGKRFEFPWAEQGQQNDAAEHVEEMGPDADIIPHPSDDSLREKRGKVLDILTKSKQPEDKACLWASRNRTGQVQDLSEKELDWIIGAKWANTAKDTSLPQKFGSILRDCTELAALNACAADIDAAKKGNTITAEQYDVLADLYRRRKDELQGLSA